MRKRRGFIRLHKDQRGLVALLWVLSFAGFLAFLAIVMEAGLLFAERRDLQNAADAGALAGGQALLLGAAAAEADGVTWAGKNQLDTGTIVTATAYNPIAGQTQPTHLRVTVRDDANHTFGGWLKIGPDKVSATAVVQLAATELPGPGVVFLGVEQPEYDQKLTFQQTNPLPDTYPLLLAQQDDYYTVMRFGAGAGSNAGYLDIDGGGASQNVRDCLAYGSSDPLLPVEPSQTGIAAGPASQGLQIRLQAAQANNCYTWDEIRSSFNAFQAGQSPSWRCSPLQTQASAVVRIPIIFPEFLDQNGTQNANVFRPDGTVPYVLGYFWVGRRPDLQADREQLVVHQQRLHRAGAGAGGGRGGGGGGPGGGGGGQGPGRDLRRLHARRIHRAGRPPPPGAASAACSTVTREPPRTASCS